MPLPLPNLDDRSYADLLEEARTLIPGAYRGWTDHNPTDAGITLIELFAWLAEMLIYRSNRIADEQIRTFLRLLNPPTWEPSADLAEDIRATVVDLRRRDRAVTCLDYEALAREAAPDVIARTTCVPRRYLGAGTEAARTAQQTGHVSVIVVPARTFVVFFDGTEPRVLAEAGQPGGAPITLNRSAIYELYVGSTAPFGGIRFDLEGGGGYTLRWEYYAGSTWAPLTKAAHKLADGTANWSAAGIAGWTIPSGWAPATVAHLARYWIRITTSSVPSRVARALRIVPDIMPQPSPALIQQVLTYLEPRRLLTTRHHVVGPLYAPVSAEILIGRRADVPEQDLRTRVHAALADFLDPLSGGAEGRGWPFGRDVYVSELFELLERVPGVDYVVDVAVASECPPGSPRCVAAQELWHDDGEQIGLGLAAHHLPQAVIDPAAIISATDFVPLQVPIEVTAAAPATAAELRRAVKSAVRRRFHPLHGGPDGSEELTITLAAIRARVRELPHVATVEAIDLSAEPSRLVRDDNGKVTGVRFQARELADVQTRVVIREGVPS